MKKPSEEKQILDAAMEGASAEVLQRYGAAVKEHVSAYSGKDAGKSLAKGLKSISHSKVHPDHKAANIKQQAGFSAEVKSVARKNAEHIMKGEPDRLIRTDDVLLDDGTKNINDQIYDISELDANGKFVPTSQMKFVGKDAPAMLDRLCEKKFEKYFEQGATIDIPDDFYEELIGTGGKDGLIDRKIADLKAQLERMEKDGKTEAAESIRERIEKNETIKRSIRKSGLTNKEAIEARKHPLLSTGKDIVKVSARAGLEAAKIGAAVSGSISIVKNMVSYTKGEIDAEEAAKRVVKDTAYGSEISFATAFSGSAINGIMKNASSETVRTLAGTNLATTFVVTLKDVGVIVSRYCKGELDGTACVEEFGRKCVGQLGSAMYSTIATSAVSGGGAVMKISAGVAGSTFGFMAATRVFEECKTALKEYQLAKEERIRVEAACEEAVAMIRQYRDEMNRAVEEYLDVHLSAFEEGFDSMDRALLEDDINGFLAGNARIQEVLGHGIQFRNQEEFDSLMLSDEAFTL
ncbi:MAG: hypothetical protein IK016_04545 [Lachnospiraceae bacterium]|nr:hypothetical protein [Lachnospiraceae bacterium]